MFNLFKKKKPNIIMIMLDGTRSDAIEKISYFQELKKEAVFLPQLITYAPYSIGSLHAMFSGIYGNVNGVNGYYRSYSFDKDNCFTLTQYLKENGYYTETDLPAEGVVPSQGFDKYRIHDEFKIDFIERHLEVLRQIKDKTPFFLFIRYGGMHVNMINTVIKKYTDFDQKYFSNNKKNFENYLEWAVQAGIYVEALMEKIKEFNLYNNSIIMVFADHGASTGDKIGEKAYGVYLYDYTIKCFMYIAGKGFSKNIVVKKQVRSIDILPTILEILHIKEKNNYKKIQGSSFLQIIYGREEERIAYSSTGGLGGPTPSPEKHNVHCIRTNKWKLIYNSTDKKKELYDIEFDIEEKNNLIGKHHEIEDELFNEMKKYLKESN